MGNFNRTKKYFLPFTFIFFFLMIYFGVNAQDLCNPSTNPNYISNQFELLTPNVGCGPYTVKLEDKSGGSDVKYVYYYQNQSVLDSIESTTELENTYFAPKETSTYTILQHGKKPNGKTFYSCKNVTVNPELKPIFSFNSCNGNFLRINIPIDTNNIFDYYEIDWSDGNAKEIINNLPYDGYKSYPNYSTTKTISVNGKFNNGNLSCDNLISKTINMIEDGNYSNIDQIELDSTLQIVNIDFNGSFDYYKFFVREKKGTFSNGNWEFETLPGKIESPSANGETCFSSFRNFGCIEVSGEVCSVPISDFYRVRKDNVIEWEEHPVGIVNNIYNADAIVDSVTYKMLRVSLEDNSLTIFDNPANPFYDHSACTNAYSYQVEASVYGTIRGNGRSYVSKSLSQKVEINSSSYKPESLSDLSVSIEDELPIIKFTDNSPSNLKKEMYFLVDSEGNAIDSSSILSPFSPKVLQTKQSLCFSIKYRDECQSFSKLSPEVCSIFLETNGTDEIAWEEYLPFSPENITAFEILTEDETDGTLVTLLTKAGFDSDSYFPNLDDYQNEAMFIIRAVTNNGKESFSNEVIIPIETKLFLPTAFRPNVNNENAYFKLFGNTDKIYDFEIVITNRWGNIVFSSNDVNFIWDGAYKNEIVPFGLYSYSLKGKNQNNVVIAKSGSIYLVK